MHEMSITASLLSIIKQEMQKSGATRLISVSVRAGTLANIVPESLAMTFEVLTVGTEIEGAALEIVEEALSLSCGGCHKVFAPEASILAVFSPCPLCGEEFGHTVLAGKELYLDRIEVE